MSKIKHYLIYALIRIAWLMWLFFTFDFLIAESDPTSVISHDQYIASIYNTLKTNGGIPSKYANRKWLIAIFCKTILDKKIIDWFYPIDAKGNRVSSRLFTPKDSLFIFVLCNSLDGQLASNNYTPNLSNKSIQAETLKQQKLQIKLLNDLIKKEKDDIKKEELIKQRNQWLQTMQNTMDLGVSTDTTYRNAHFLKINTFNDLVSDNKRTCNWSTDLNNCSLSRYLSQWFHQIINDYTNSKIAWLYANIASIDSNNKTEGNTVSIEKSIKNFSDYYFEKCGNEDSSPYLYINSKQIDEGDKSYCSHPNTYKVLSNYLTRAYAKTSKNVIINYTELIDDKKPFKGLIKEAIASTCSFVWDSSLTTLDCGLDDFKHLITNELLFYGLFMEFYSHYIVTSEQFGPLTLGKDKITTQEVLDEEARKSQLEIEVANESIMGDMKIIRNLFANFSIHIWYVAYLEDLVNFRNELVKLYTPIHQMYYKLRNAQTYER